MQTTRRTALIAAAMAALAAAGCGKPGGKPAVETLSAGGGAASDAGTVQTISQAIAADPQLGSLGIQIAEDRGSIALTGSVPNADLKDRAEKIVYDAQNRMKQQPGVWNYLLLPEK
jgi:hypothetical protein